MAVKIIKIEFGFGLHLFGFVDDILYVISSVLSIISTINRY